MKMELDWIERDVIMLAIQEFLANNKKNDEYHEELIIMRKVGKKISKTISVVD